MKEVYLKEISNSWSIVSTKYVYKIQLGKMLQNEANSDEDVQISYFKAADVQWENVNTDNLPVMWASMKDLNKFSVFNGDLLVCEGGEVGRAGMVYNLEKDCIIQNALHRVRSTNKAEVKYLMYMLRHIAATSWMDVLCNKATIAHFTSEKFGDLRIPLPSVEEQKMIIQLLDNQTTKIDTLISKKQKLIELLQEKRQAIIYEAVTKGLDPKVSKKDSGIEWLGNVPAHWKLQKFKNIVSMVGGGTPSKDNLEYWNGEIPWVSPKDMKVDYIDSSEDRITHLGLMNSSTTLIDKPSVLMVVRSGILKHTLPVAVNIVPVSLNQDMKALVPKKIIDVTFLFWMLKGIGSYILFSCTKIGATVDSIETEDLNKLMIPVPPIKEQLVIIEKIKAKAEKIDLLVNKIKEQIEKLKEYRQSLISEAVTGKINVRNYGEEIQE